MSSILQKDGWIWMDGKMIPWDQSYVHILTHGLHYGSSVFEGIRTYNGKIFKNKEHMERLLYSAKMLDMDNLPWDVPTLVKIAEDVCKKNGLTDGYVRPIIWRGAETMGIDARKALPHLSISAWAWGNYFDNKDKGISLITSPWKKPPSDCIPSQAKCGGIYVTNSLNKHYALSQGYDDSLVLDWRGQVAESSGANLFLVIDGIIKTPKPDCFLNGITRQTAIGLAKDLGYTVEETVIWPDDLKDVTEAFVTGTAAEITAVSKINDLAIPVGEITKSIQKAYEKITKG